MAQIPRLPASPPARVQNSHSVNVTVTSRASPSSADTSPRTRTLADSERPREVDVDDVVHLSGGEVDHLDVRHAARVRLRRARERWCEGEEGAVQLIGDALECGIVEEVRERAERCGALIVVSGVHEAPSAGDVREGDVAGRAARLQRNDGVEDGALDERGSAPGLRDADTAASSSRFSDDTSSPSARPDGDASETRSSAVTRATFARRRRGNTRGASAGTRAREGGRHGHGAPGSVLEDSVGSLVMQRTCLAAARVNCLTAPRSRPPPPTKFAGHFSSRGGRMKNKKKLRQKQEEAEARARGELAEESSSSDEEEEEEEERAAPPPKKKRKAAERVEADDDSEEEIPDNRDRPAPKVDFTGVNAKEKCLILSSRGVTSRYRHLMLDIGTLIPHSKKDSKLDTKNPRGMPSSRWRT